MSQSVAGNTEAPGKNVRVKSGLNKSILDQGWFEFRRQLAYKLAWRGGWLVAVPPHKPTTQEERRRWANAKVRRQLRSEMEQRQREVRQAPPPPPD